MIVQETSASVSYTRKVAVRPQGHYTKADFQFVDELVACDLDNAPEYQWQNPSGEYLYAHLKYCLTKI